jgi:hypothetical protein
MSTEVETVVIRDLSSGRYHLAFRVGDILATPEACNRDDAGAYEIVEPPEGAEPDELCQRCFPPVEASV